MVDENERNRLLRTITAEANKHPLPYKTTVEFSDAFMEELKKRGWYRQWQNELKQAPYQPMRGKYVHTRKGKPQRQHALRSTLKPSGVFAFGRPRR